MTDTLHVKGLCDLFKVLEQVLVEKNIMRAALRAGSVVIADEVRAKFPVSTPARRENFPSCGAMRRWTGLSRLSVLRR